MMDTQPEDVPVGTPETPVADNAGAPPTLGAALREARERLGLSVTDVANRLRFAQRQIEALETNDFARLPELAFVRGFVRSYAKLLQLDPAPLLAMLPQPPQASVPPAADAALEVPFPNIYLMRMPNIVWLSAALLVTIAIALFILLHRSAPAQPKVQVAALPVVPIVPVVPVVAMQPPASSAVPPVAKVASAAKASAKVPAASGVLQTEPKPVATHRRNGIIRMVFDEDSWVEITDGNGKTLLAQLNPRGSERGLNGTPPFSLVIGHASGVHLYYKGEAVDLAPHTSVEVARLKLE